MKDLYRKSALEKISSPEQTDKVIRITSPLSWLALVGVMVMMIIVIFWVFFGTITETITVGGIITAPNGTNAVYTDVTGTVGAVYVEPGDILATGQSVMEITVPGGSAVTIASDHNGVVSEMIVTQGDIARKNSEVIRMSPAMQSKQAVVCYVPVSSVKKLKRGMQAYVMLTDAEGVINGHMLAHIVSIDARASSRSSLESVLGIDNGMTEFFDKNRPVTAVVLELYLDERTVSGYYWSNSRGARQEVFDGSLCNVRLVIRKIHPIEILFSRRGRSKDV